ncbi:hypothetical protein EJB05_55485, partial [Eragrostis curvula]
MSKITAVEVCHAMDCEKSIRNICVIGDPGHGKSTLADLLLSFVGTPKVMSGDFVADNGADEADGVTTNRSSFTFLCYDYESTKKSQSVEKKYCINLFDSPGRVDLSTETLSSLHISDGAVAVVDCMKGVSLDTEYDKRNTGSPTCKRGFVQFCFEPIKQVYTICMKGRKTELCSILQKLGLTLEEDEKVLVGEALLECVMKKWLPAGDLITMMVHKLPPAAKAQKYRVKNLYDGPLDDAYATAVRNCDPDGPLMLYISNFIPSPKKDSLFAFGRVFSGRVISGMKVRIMGPNYIHGQDKDLTINSVRGTLVLTGKKVEAVDFVRCGTNVVVDGLDQIIKGHATLTNEKEIDAYPIKPPMRFTESPILPIVVKSKELVLDEGNTAVEVSTLQQEIAAKLAFFEQDFVKSVRLLTKSIEAEPARAQLYSDRAMVFNEMGKYAEAIADGNRALELDNTLCNAYYQIAFSYVKQQEYKRASTVLKSGLKFVTGDFRYINLMNECEELLAKKLPMSHQQINDTSCTLKHKEAIECSQNQSPSVYVLYDTLMTKLHRPRAEKDMENPDRYHAIIKAFNSSGLLDRCMLCTEAVSLDRQYAIFVHDEEYVRFIESLTVKMHEAKKLPNYLKYGGDEIVCSVRTAEGVFLAAGAVVQACQAVATGVCKSAFAIVRPPGHHAMRAKASGYCFLNNNAIGARYLQRVHNFSKILVVDFDVHHGDGTQEIFYDDNTVLFCSLHRHGLFPITKENKPVETKTADYIGGPNALGYNINLDLVCELRDEDVLAVFDYLFLPLAEQFKPDFVLVSAGYDAAEGDLMGGSKLKNILHGNIVLSLEGGYNNEALSKSCVASLKGLLGDELMEPVPYKYEMANEETWKAIKKAHSQLRGFWPIFQEEIQLPPDQT